jgi:NDP-sugar pyrophosphorylase family protein
MAVDHALILSAGFGTRMGEIGKIIPKIMWPIFERKLLSLQVSYMRQYNPGKIYINIHHQKEKILQAAKEDPNFDDVEFLIEEDILDIGGGVHNLARKVGYKGTLVINNADQFIFLQGTKFEDALAKAQEKRATLFVYEIDTKDRYNILDVDQDNNLTRIIDKNDVGDRKKGFTYTGLGIINLNGLKAVDGPSRFFDSVANYLKEAVELINIEDSIYWDFGTPRRYYNSHFRAVSMAQKPDDFVNFLIKEKAFDVNKVNSDLNGYGSSHKLIDLSSGEHTGEDSIILEKTNRSEHARGIYFKDLVETNID